MLGCRFRSPVALRARVALGVLWVSFPTKSRPIEGVGRSELLLNGDFPTAFPERDRLLLLLM
jgi:hypothetical protein